LERKLTAILCADVFGYSRLMGEDEEATLRTLSSHRKLIDSLIEQHRGRFVNSAGDSVLAEFASVVNAVQCAVDIETTLKAENANLPPERRMEFRIGVNLGDVMVDGEQIYGDGVNVAARLESLAEPGGKKSQPRPDMNRMAAVSTTPWAGSGRWNWSKAAASFRRATICSDSGSV